jgi:hypothetical protein
LPFRRVRKGNQVRRALLPKSDYLVYFEIDRDADWTMSWNQASPAGFDEPDRRMLRMTADANRCVSMRREGARRRRGDRDLLR